LLHSAHRWPNLPHIPLECAPIFSAELELAAGIMRHFYRDDFWCRDNHSHDSIRRAQATTSALWSPTYSAARRISRTPAAALDATRRQLERGGRQPASASGAVAARADSVRLLIFCY